jgi:hypothetical protein
MPGTIIVFDSALGILEGEHCLSKKSFSGRAHASSSDGPGSRLPSQVEGPRGPRGARWLGGLGRPTAKAFLNLPRNTSGSIISRISPAPSVIHSPAVLRSFASRSPRTNAAVPNYQ